MLNKIFSFFSKNSKQDPSRWLIIDCESSGLNPKEDHLLSIAAIGIKCIDNQLSIVYSDLFEAFTKPPLSPTKNSTVATPQLAKQTIPNKQIENVLIHGIGIAQQTIAEECFEVMQEFNKFAAGAGLIGYNSYFDQALLTHTASRHGTEKLPNHWLDLNPVVSVLFNEARNCSLDSWLNRMGIVCPERHNAVADCLVTAELLLCIWPKLMERGFSSWSGLLHCARQHGTREHSW